MITCINIDNGLDLLVYVVFSMSLNFGLLGPKAQHLVICFCLCEG